jgi:hypothetical protein
VPPWRDEYNEPAAATFVLAFGKLITFEHFSVEPILSFGSDNELTTFANMTRARLTPKVEQPHTPSEQRKLAVLSGLGAAYQIAAPWATCLAAVAFVVAGLLAAVRRQFPYLLVLGAAFLAALCCRMAILAVIEVTTGPILNPVYMASAYPLLLAFIVVGTTAGALSIGSLRLWQRRPAAAEGVRPVNAAA